jgi:hypothetical protein
MPTMPSPVKLFPPLLTAAALLALAACASTAPAPRTKAAPQEAAAPPPHVCNAAASYVTFASLGVPTGDRAIDLVTTDHYDYVLFAPARLLRLSREEGKVKVEMIHGEPGQEWKALALDPIDSSVWVATGEFVLIHVSPSLHQQEVPIQRVAGSGGFVRLVVGTDNLYAAPACAKDGVWRISRDGRILSSAFPAAADASPAADALAGCSMVRLDRDPQGRIVVWDWKTQKLKRVDDQGEWRDVDGGVFAELPDARALKGVDVGGGGEQWYFTGAAGLFLWKGRPVFLGAATIRGGKSRGADTVLLVPEAGAATAREVIESCHGAPIRRVAATAVRYAALAGDGIVLGDFATAPDLP